MVFNSRAELAEHYKSEWHRYNLKRKELGLELLNEQDFNRRLAAALALKKEKEQAKIRAGTSHLKHPKQQRHKQQQQHHEEVKEEVEEEEEEEAPAPPVIDPLQCLFSNKQHQGIDENIQYMQKRFGFFIPESEYLVDKLGLVGYCHEKVKLGHMCLYCQRVFPTWQGTQQHMVDSSHCKLKYEEGIDIHEYEPFYDFSKANEEFMQHFQSQSQARPHKDCDDEDMDEGSEGGWEDIDEDEVMEGYQAQALKRGFDVTELGELVFPDGRVVGHRALSKYYKQRFSPNHTDNPAVASYLRSMNDHYSINAAAQQSYLRGGGVLVPQQKAATGGTIVTRGSGLANYTALSVYRYKAVVKKAKREEASGYRQYQKYYNRHNRFDKKGNRMMNGVSVAHAKR